MVLDVSEDGLALATALAVPDKQLLNIAIPSDQAHQLIEVTGRVVWISESKRRVGLQLVEPSASSQEFLRKWVATVLERTPLEAPAVSKFDAATWNPAAIVDNCAALPLRPAASEEIAKREFEVVRGLRSQPELTAPELTAVERPQPRGSLVVMGAGHARIAAHIPTTHVPATPTPTMALVAPTSATLDPAIPSAVIPSHEASIPAASIPPAPISETAGSAIASFATAIPVTQVPETQVPEADSEEALFGKAVDRESDLAEASQLELLMPLETPFVTLPVTTLPAEILPEAKFSEEILSAEMLPPTKLQEVVIPTEIADAVSEVTTAAPAILTAEQETDSVDANEETKLFAVGALTIPDAGRENTDPADIWEEQHALPSLASVPEDEPTPILAAKAKPAASKVAGYAVSAGKSSRSSALLFASVAVITVSFAIGILIGRSVLTRTFGGDPTTAAAAAPSTVSSGNGRLPGGATRGSALATTGFLSAATSATSSSTISSATSSATSPVEQAPRIAAENGAGTAPNAAADQGNSSAAAAESAAGVEMMVTPNEGDAPLRVDLPEEVVAQTATLEIRAQRYLAVPGARTQRGHKVRKERVVIGPLLSRVIPQTPDADSGTPGGEQVVSVRATIDGDGHVTYVDPLNGPISLMPVVMSAVREWRFAPSSIHGEPLRTEVDLTLKFRAKK